MMLFSFVTYLDVQFLEKVANNKKDNIKKDIV